MDRVAEQCDRSEQQPTSQFREEPDDVDRGDERELSTAPSRSVTVVVVGLRGYVSDIT
jgi:hypothetical protein